jgi:hypothetical protein
MQRFLSSSKYGPKAGGVGVYDHVSRLRMWSLSPNQPIIAVTALVTLVNSVDKPERPTRGAQVRHSTRPVTEIEPVVDESLIPEVLGDRLHPAHA